MLTAETLIKSNLQLCLPLQLYICHCNTTNNTLLLLFYFPSPGDVHIGIVDRGGQLEVEVNQARGLTPKPGSKNIPGMGIAHPPPPLG